MSQPARANNKQQYLIISLLVIFILTIWLATRFFNQSTPTIQQGLVKAANCDLRTQSCAVNFGEINLTLDVNPKMIRSLTPLTYKVTISGAETETVMIDLQGVDMFMGLNQAQLSPVAGKKGSFTGTGELGVCTTGEMMWRATLIAETSKGQLKTWFDFPAR